MSLKYSKLSKHPEIFKRLMGIDVKEFDKIIVKLAPVWKKKVVDRYKRPGRPHRHDLPELLMILLLYYRTYMTQMFIGFMFGIDDSNVCRNIKMLEPVLATVVAIQKDRTVSKAEADDATEQPIERPRKKQKQHYSGKRP